MIFLLGKFELLSVSFLWPGWPLFYFSSHFTITVLLLHVLSNVIVCVQSIFSLSTSNLSLSLWIYLACFSTCINCCNFLQGFKQDTKIEEGKRVYLGITLFNSVPSPPPFLRKTTPFPNIQINFTIFLFFAHDCTLKIQFLIAFLLTMHMKNNNSPCPFLSPPVGVLVPAFSLL